MNWTEEYRPTEPDGVVGNENTARKVVHHIDEWEPGDDHLLLHGPPGIGKTTTAHIAAQETGRRTFEINASDRRTRGSIEEELVETVTSDGWLGEGRVVIVDEADNLDRGGNSAMTTAIDRATEPMILTANDLYDGMSRNIQNRCETIEFDEPSNAAILERLRYIAQQEQISVEGGALELVAEQATDVRGAVNDMQAAVSQGWAPITADTVDVDRTPRDVFLGSETVDRDDVWTILESFFGGRDPERWRLRGAPGFEEVVAEYARDREIPYEIYLPKHEDHWGRHDGLDDMICGADIVTQVFGPDETIDPGEYAQTLVGTGDSSYGWINAQSSGETFAFWESLPGSRADFSDLS